MGTTRISSLSPEEQLKQAQKSGEWFAPSLFITWYGKWGYKFEAECYKHNKDGTIENDYLNVDGKDYQDAKTRFWKVWNREHKGAKLHILKSVSASGL